MTAPALRHIVFLPLPTAQFGGNLGIIRHDLLYPKSNNSFWVNRFQFKPNRVWFAGSSEVIEGVRRKFWIVSKETATPIHSTLSFKEEFDLVANQLQRLRDNRDLRLLMQEASEHAVRELKVLERLTA